MEVSVLKQQSPAGHCRDLREWLDRVRAIGELEEVNGADWNLEIGIISELNAKRTNSKAFLFDEIKGYRSEERRVGKECRSRWSPYH